MPLENPNLSEKAKADLENQLKILQAGEAEEEKELQESRKMGKQILNKVMTRKTLSFDKLFRSVVN